MVKSGYIATSVAVIAAVAGGIGIWQASRRETPKTLSPEILSVTPQTRLDVYVDPGNTDANGASKVLEAPVLFGGGVSGMIMVKPDPNKKKAYVFSGATITPPKGNELESLRLRIRNVGHASETIHLGDVRFRDKDGNTVEFVAVSRGTSAPFVKKSGDERTIAKGIPLAIAAKDDVTLTFVFIDAPARLPSQFTIGRQWRPLPVTNTGTPKHGAPGVGS